MDYTTLVTKRGQYKYSVNICFDLRDEERIAGFIPNVTTTEIFREYLGGMIRGNSDVHSRILYGSYGTGKSHLLTVMSAILGHINIKGEGFENLTKLIAKYDKELAADIRQFSKEKKPYLVVPVYSDYDDFGKCITFSLKKELDRNNIPVTFKGFFDEAIVLVKKWNAGKESSSRLEEVCKKQKITVENLMKGLSIYASSYEKVFNKIYSGMSYGAAFNSTAGNLIDNMNYANEAIKDKYRGIVLVFDEFGRYVEDYGEILKVKAVQDLAEYCDHSDNNNYLILVSHKQLSMYTSAMKKSISDEWKKVEGRFKATSINIKYDQCLSLIGNIIPKNQTYWKPFKIKFDKVLNDLYSQVWNFKGFMLPPETDGSSVFEDGYPLHPITLFALDRLSKKVAQNERTFFTYLAGDEENSLFSQLQNYDTREFHFIGLDAIYDYFELNIKSFKTDNSYAIYKKLQIALNKLGTDKKGYQTKILKTLAVINIVSDTDVLIADKNTLACVVDGNPQAVATAIDDLEKKKIIKYMRQYGYYDYFDSSIFDLEKMIEDKIPGISDEMLVRILNEKFADFALYPYRYNETYFINRIFIPAFVTKGELTKKSFYNTLPKYYDGIVIFVLDNQADEKEYAQISGLPKRVLLVVNGKSKAVEEEVKRYIALQYFYSKKEELAEDDPTIVNELTLYLSEQVAIVEELIRKWRTLQDPGTFVMNNGNLLDITSEKDLSGVLSDIMDAAFDKTPMINNDLFTKNNLTGAIKLARKKALECIMGQDNIYDGCPMLSPEYNILRAALSRTGIVDNNTVREENRVTEDSMYYLPDEQHTVSGSPVMGAIQRKLRETGSERLALSDLYEMLKAEPYGLRDGVIPVLLAYALRDYQNVSLYFHGNEHSYTEEELVKALSEPENYTLFICNWKEEEIAYIEGLEKLFADYLPKGDRLNRLEELFRAINTHYASISKSARTTEVYVSVLAKQYRDILNITYKDYNAFFFDVLPCLNADLQELVLQIGNIKEELESVEEKLYVRVERVIKQVFDLDDTDDLMQYLQVLYREDWEEKSQKAFDYTTNNVLDLVSRASEMDEERFVLELAKATTGFELSYWTDNKINSFEEIFRDAVNKLNEYNPEEGLQQGEMKITIESADAAPLITQFSKEELSVTGKTMLKKLQKTLGEFGESISYEEKISILTEIMKEIIG